MFLLAICDRVQPNSLEQSSDPEPVLSVNAESSEDEDKGALHPACSAGIKPSLIQWCRDATDTPSSPAATSTDTVGGSASCRLPRLGML